MIEEIKAFCAVVEEHSLTKAARKLGVSTPMMTRRIQRLEGDLEAKLLHRTTREVSLTEGGKLFYEQALEMLAHYEAGVKSLESLTQQVTGTIKIGLPVSISHLWVAPVLIQFCEKYPDVKIHIINGNHLLDLLQEGFDIILHCGNLPDSSFYFKKIRDWYKLTCASPDYLNKQGFPKHPRDLSKHNCINHYERFSNTWNYCIDGKVEEIFVDGAVKVNSSLDLKNLARSGMGLVQLPDFSVQHEIEAKRLITVLDEYRPNPLGMYAIYPSKQYLSKKTEAMLDFLVGLF